MDVEVWGRDDSMISASVKDPIQSCVVKMKQFNNPGGAVLRLRFPVF